MTKTLEDFATLSGPQMVAYYNRIAAELDENLVKRFSTKSIGAQRCAEITNRKDEAEHKAAFKAPTKKGKATPKAEQKKAPVQEIDKYVSCPHCGIHLSNGVITDGDEGVNGDAPIKTKEFKHICMACDKEFGPRVRKPRAASGNLSEAIAKSWTDPEVKAKRATRHAVRVNWGNTSSVQKGKVQEFRSVRQAFIALNLPLNEHIKFRMELKAAGSLTRYKLDWTVIEA